MPAFALPILSFLKSRLGIGLIAAIAVALLWARGTHYRDQRDAAKRDAQTYAFAAKTNLASVNLLTATLDKQSAMVREWAATSERRQKAAKEALSAAKQHGRTLEAKAARILAEMPVPGDCRTSDAVMAARGDL